MTKRFTILLLSFLIPAKIWAQEPLENESMKPGDTEVFAPVPEMVSPGDFMSVPPPSDGEVLFDGQSLSKWENAKTGGPALWNIEDGVMTVKPGAGDIQTKQKYEDFQLHIEWRLPYPSQNTKGKYLGNSGVFLQSQYEIQILDSYENESEIYVNGQAGSIYKQSPPLVNACRPPGEWQSFDIVYYAPRFNDDGSLKSPAVATVFQNGILIQNHVKLKGRTLHVGHPYYMKHGPMPLVLQDHEDLVAFRNIWIRPL